jgi:hypothetical protein
VGPSAASATNLAVMHNASFPAAILAIADKVIE